MCCVEYPLYTLCTMNYSLKVVFTAVICLGYCYGQEMPFLYLGCYSMYPPTNITTRFISEFTADKCFKVCSSLKTTYAGLNSAYRLCYCGHSLSRLNPTREDSSLCVPCQEDSTKMCAGHVDSTSIYKLNATSNEEGVGVLTVSENSIQLFNISTNDSTLLADLGSEYSFAVDYHYERDEVYTLWNYSLCRLPLGLKKTVTSEAPPEVLLNYMGCKTFAVDWVHNHIIMPDCGIDAHIGIYDLDGNNYHNLITLPKEHSPEILDIVVDPYKGLLFWLARNSLRRCELDGRNLKTLIQPLPTQETHSLTLDILTEKIYFTGIVDGSASIFVTDYDGSQFQNIEVSSLGERVLSIGAFRSQIYFLRYDIINYENHLMRITLSANDTSLTELIMSPQRELRKLKLVHLELQSPPAVYACTHRECSHHCVVEDSLARCRCPPGLQVGSDDKTCEDIPKSADLVHIIFGGLISVVFVVLAAAVLMAICDKLWSRIHPKTVRITARKASNRPVTYNIQDDSDNLI